MTTPTACPTCGHVAAKGAPLTRRQRELLDFISERLESDGYAPSVSEICERFGFRSTATAHEHLTNLVNKGWIERGFNAARSLILVGDERFDRQQ